MYCSIASFIWVKDQSSSTTIWSWSWIFMRKYKLTHLGGARCQDFIASGSIVWEMNDVEGLIWSDFHTNVRRLSMAGFAVVADYVVVVLMLVVPAGIGVYYVWVNRGQGSSGDFLTGGHTLTALPSVSLCLTALSHRAEVTADRLHTGVQCMNNLFLTSHCVSDPACCILFFKQENPSSMWWDVFTSLCLNGVFLAQSIYSFIFCWLVLLIT